MAHFSLTDLSNRSGEVVEAALRGPVEITRRGKRKFMLLTAEDYDRLVSAADTRRALHADDAPEGSAAMMLKTLARTMKIDVQAARSISYGRTSRSAGIFHASLML